MSHFSKRKAKKQEAATTSREVAKDDGVIAPLVEEVLPVAAEDAADAPADLETAVEEETLPMDEEADREAAPAEEAAAQTTDILADLEGEAEDGAQEKVASEIAEMKAKLYGEEEAEPTTGMLCCA